jgi:hypothetical protein
MKSRFGNEVKRKIMKSRFGNLSLAKKVGVSCAAVLLCLALAACGGPTVAEYISTIGVGVDSIIAVEAPTWTGATTLNALFTTAETAAANWKAGTSSAEIQQTLGALAAGLDDLPLGTKADDLIAAAVNAIDNLTTLVQSESSALTPQTQSAAFMAWLDAGPPTPATTPGRKHTWKGKPIKSLKDFKKQWNKSAPIKLK